MPQHGESSKKEPAQPLQTAQSGSLRSETRWPWFITPEPIKRLFNRFPLQTYALNELPQRQTPDRTKNNLYVFTTSIAAELGSPSFNPACLKWQAYLRFKAIPFSTVPSNNHASPTGALPFLLPACSVLVATENSTAIPSTKLQRWACVKAQKTASKLQPSTCKQNNHEFSNGSLVAKYDQKSEPTSTVAAWRDTTVGAGHSTKQDQELETKRPENLWEEPSSTKYEAYMALLDKPIRNAWLYFLYIEPSNFSRVAYPLYITSCSSNFLVRKKLAHNLWLAAKSELLYYAPLIDVELLYRECERAFSAMSKLLGKNRWFFAAEEPGLFDASVYAYTNVLLDEEMDWQNTRMIRGLKRFENLVQHRVRILESYFPVKA